METTCGSLLLELQDIWDEVGEPDGARDRMLLELERECMEVYRRKVDQANRGRAQLRQAIAESEAELAAICSAMGEPLVHVKQSNQKSGALLEEINAIGPYLEEMKKKKKIERWSQILGVVGQIEKISSEIRPAGFVPFKIPVDESDLTLRKLEELRMSLQSLEEEKKERIKQVMKYFNTLHSLCEVLGIDFKQTISEVEAEVLRLEQLKASKMKELIMKKKAELEEHRRRAHLVRDEGYAAQFSIEAIEVGVIDPCLLLEQIEAYIATVKEDAFSRKDILERVERWLSACEEEAWLEDYNKDDNRYSAGRGAHIMLKRAEKARVLVNKIPGMVDILTAKIIAWEKERSTEFTYDGARLLSVLEEFMIVRHEKERERKRQRDQKKLQDQFKAEQELLYGSKPSPSKSNSAKKPICDCSRDENRTPKKIVVPTPRTPMTVSAPMQMATTALGTTKTTPVRLAYDKPQLNLQQGVEYSFEERRLAVYRAAQVP
ncbi:hypothetical protein QOZ80_5AG0364010 [Eleusine coracana subsp. coracana]|nr:hypothetical protein QOZ80_5AG0364010 [Eleusine coracana subsp. coracana]